jgi:hypothetical protein
LDEEHKTRINRRANLVHIEGLRIKRTIYLRRRWWINECPAKMACDANAFGLTRHREPCLFMFGHDTLLGRDARIGGTLDDGTTLIKKRGWKTLEHPKRRLRRNEVRRTVVAAHTRTA